MAHKKGQGSVKNGRESNAQRLGIKVFGGGSVTIGCIILRQRGTKFHPGKNVRRAKDDTLSPWQMARLFLIAMAVALMLFPQLLLLLTKARF